MTASVSKAGPYYSSGQIKFSDLRRDFRSQVRKETSSGSESFPSDSSPIKASELLRNTTTTNSNPVVPDATENANISISSNWKVSQFRGSIKYYYIAQSGTDINFDIDSQSWNSNLNKTIKKFLFIDGTCGSNDATISAASLNATAYNLTVDVYGIIMGASGKGGGIGGGLSGDISGQKGGDALEMTSSGGANNVVLVRDGSKIYGGGGGGEKGATGADGSAGTCSNVYYINQCSVGAPSCAGGWYQTASGWGCCEWNRGCAVARWTRTCQQDFSVPGAPGGAGGSGGPGRGYNNQSGSLAGQNGSPGMTGGCPTYGGTGDTGETGGSGAEWGLSGNNTSNTGNGGSSGRAVFGSNYSMSGKYSNADYVKGAY